MLPIQKRINFRGTFWIKDPKILSGSNQFDPEIFRIFDKIETTLQSSKDDCVTLISMPVQDMSIFAKLNELGLEFTVEIWNKFNPSK